MVLAAGEVDAGREVFLGFGPVSIAVFYGLTLIALIWFTRGVVLRVRKYRRGGPVSRVGWQRLARGLADVFSQRTVGKRDRYVGIAHGLVFWGFLVLFVGTAIIAVDEDILGLVKPEWQFWHGAFYVVYALTLDVFGLAFIAGLLMLGWRRRTRPPRLDYARVDRDTYDRSGYALDDRAFLAILVFLGASGYLLEGFRIAATDFPSFEAVSIVGWAVASASTFLGSSGADTARVVTWWIHTGAALAFVAYLPYSKGVHMLTDPVDLIVTDRASARSLPPVEDLTRPGIGSLEAMTWKHLLDFDACTKCGRCHEVCPARASGAPLSPRDLVLDLRELADTNAGIRLWYGPGAEPGFGGAGEIPGPVIAPATLWACTTCMACMETCPVGIEHVPLIVGMRRHLVDAGEVNAGLQDAFQGLAKGGNSLGKPAKMRARWTRGLDFDVADARTDEVETLWFVGDYASFHTRAIGVTQTVARLYRRAGIDFGILHDGERNAGNDVRRAGEEGLFEMLRDHNLAAVAAAAPSRIVTTDPHSLNTLRHEYGLDIEVLHYTQVLDDAVTRGLLNPGGLVGRATYHDPCYLGRYAGEYEAPRRLIRATGLEVIEMGRCRENSFCCGAGGVRISMVDEWEGERPAENRIREAVALGDDVRWFVVACPKDVVMYTDAVKSTGNEDRLEVIDVAELLERALATEEALVD